MTDWSTSPSDKTPNMAKAKATCGASIQPNAATSRRQLAMKVEDGKRVPIPHKRIQAVEEERRSRSRQSELGASFGTTSMFDQNGDGEIDFEEEMHRRCGTVAIKDDLLYIADFSGLVHCLDAKGNQDGKPIVHFTYDMLAQSWGSPLIADGHVFIGDEDGDVVDL